MLRELQQSRSGKLSSLYNEPSNSKAHGSSMGIWLILATRWFKVFRDLASNKTRTALVERSALGLTNAQVGDVVTIKTPSGKEREVRIAGLAHDLYAKLFVLDGMAYGYTTFDTMEWLGESRDRVNRLEQNNMRCGRTPIY